MLKSHFDAVEKKLLANSLIAANTGHSLHKGNPREAFVREFLQMHLSNRVAICTGEILSSESRPGEARNQIDIILYKPDYPRLHIGGDIYGVLSESVIATVEVKSVLTEEELQRAIKTANAIKQLKRSIKTTFLAGYQPPSILSYVVAYDGPASIKTVSGWLPNIHAKLAVKLPSMAPSLDVRVSVPSPSIDGIFVLGKGFLVFDNTPLTFVTDEEREANPNLTWVGSDSEGGNLLYLFSLLTQAVSGLSASWLDPLPYLTTFKVPNRILAP